MSLSSAGARDAPRSPFSRERLARIFGARSIAVVGASPNASFVSSILGSLFRYGYAGTVTAVNPRYDRVLDTPCFPTVGDVPGEIDLVVVGVAHRFVPDILSQCEAKQVGGVCIVTSGFSEIVDAAGADRQAELAAWAARTGIPIIGPNCLGLLNAHQRMVALPPYWEAMIPGEVGAVLQSGMMAPTSTLQLVARNVGLSLVVTAGNEAVLEAADVIEYLAHDDATRVIATFTEQVKTPARLIAACEAAAEAGKPIVMLKIGRSEGGRRAARAHTGSLVAADDVVDAALCKLGVTRVGSVDELVETVALFHTRKLPRGKGVAVISVSGGIGGILSDQAAAIGVDFPPLPEETAAALAGVVPEYGSIGNPLDVTGQAVAETHLLETSLDLLASARGIDVVVHARGWPGLLDRQQAVGIALERAVERHPEILFLVLSMSGGKLYPGPYPHTPAAEPFDRLDGVPFLQSSEYGLRAIASLLRYAEFQRRRAASDAPGPRQRITPVEMAVRARALVQTAGGRPLTERESKEILALYGIPATREILARSADDAVSAADVLGWPVALKVESPDLLHKTDAGAVLLNVPDADALLDGYDEILANAKMAQPEATIHGVLVQEMAPRGVETIVGMTHDPQWGPVVAVGLGGALVEVLRDRQLLLPPIDTGDAHAALASLRAARLFEGVRGARPSDVAALADAVARFGELCEDLADLVAEIDVNPLLVLPEGQGLLALDALIVPALTPQPPLPRAGEGER